MTVPATPHKSYGTYDDGISELCAPLLALLPRSDQRKSGELYVRGLLSVPGRKSIRNIASLMGGSAAGEQSLNHFISKSTWDWRPVRAELTRQLHAMAPTRAWVIQPRIVEKSGEHSVGVRQSVVPCLGRTVNHQHVLAVWQVSDAASVPVNWRLVLPGDWLADENRRRKVGIPDHVDSLTPTDSALSLVSDTVSALGALAEPVVMDARDADTSVLISTLVRRGISFLLRVRAGTPIVAADPAVARYGGHAMPAQRLADMSKGLRRPLGVAPEAGRAPLALRLQVMPTLNRPTGAAPAFAHPLTLLAEWESATSPAPHLWLTNLTAPTAELAALNRLTRRVDRGFGEVSVKVGALDFEGRSFQGWHHHKTLVSLAHAVAELWSAGDDMLPLADVPPAEPVCTGETPAVPMSLEAVTA